jgi:hypothetical protein
MSAGGPWIRAAALPSSTASTIASSGRFKRRAQVIAQQREWGHQGIAAGKAAALATRKAKDHTESEESFYERVASGEASSVMASAWEWTGAVEQESGSLHGPVGVVGGGGVHPWMTWGVTSGCTGVVACGWMWRLLGGGSVRS